jgi:hypothetical protein
MPHVASSASFSSVGNVQVSNHLIKVRSISVPMYEMVLCGYVNQSVWPSKFIGRQLLDRKFLVGVLCFGCLQLFAVVFAEIPLLVAGLECDA